MRVLSTQHSWNIKDECKQNIISSIKIKNTHNQVLCLKQRTERQTEEQRPHYPAIKEENAHGGDVTHQDSMGQDTYFQQLAVLGTAHRTKPKKEKVRLEVYSN